MKATKSQGARKVKPRGRKGFGSIYEQRPGLWAAAYELPRDPKKPNVRRRRTVYGASETEVKDKLKKLMRQDDPRSSTPRTSVQRFLEAWLGDLRTDPELRTATVASYELAVTAHIVPEIGEYRLEQLTAAQVQRFYRDLRKKGLGDRTVHKVHAVLHRALASAVRQELLPRNPAALGKEAPKYRAPEREPLTKKQAQILLRAARGDRFEALYVLALTTGARQGELFALRWRDVNLAAGKLTIRGTLQDVDNKGKLERGPTKTNASRRSFALSSVAIAALKKHRDRMKREKFDVAEGAFVFQASNGEPLRRQNFYQRDFHPLLERAKLPRIHFHDLRHTAATQLASIGTPVVVVAALLGHVDPVVTLRTYQYAFEGAAGDAAQRLGDHLSTSRRARRAPATR